MKVDLKDVTGMALDWLICKTGVVTVEEQTLDSLTWIETAHPSGAYSYSSDPALSAILFERAISRVEDMGDCWEAECGGHSRSGKTVYEAVGRAVVAHRMGDVVEVPDEILKASGPRNEDLPRPRAV